MNLVAGDVVILKSGGQPMTVIEIDGDQAECIWTGDEGDLFRETIPTIALEVARELHADDNGEADEAEQESEDEADAEPEDHSDKALTAA